MSKELNVLVQSSDYFAPFAGVMLTSLFENNKDIDCLTVYFMTSDLSENNRKRFQILTEKYSREIKYIDTKKIDLFLKNNSMPLWHDSYATYYKIFALSNIEDKIDRLIYLDSDMIVTDSLSELINYDLGNNLLGMCLETLSPKYNKLIGLDSPYCYNAGMIIFDVKKWIKYGGTDKIIKYINTVHPVCLSAEQDLVNIVFQNKISTIPLKYNCCTQVFAFKNYNLLKKAYGVFSYYSENEVQSAKQKPAIIHCKGFGGLYPWSKGNHPNKKVWNIYKVISPWVDFPSSKCDMTVKDIMQRTLFAILPKNLYAIIHRSSINIYLIDRARKCGLQYNK